MNKPAGGTKKQLFLADCDEAATRLQLSRQKNLANMFQTCLIIIVEAEAVLTQRGVRLWSGDAAAAVDTGTFFAVTSLPQAGTGLAKSSDDVGSASTPRCQTKQARTKQIRWQSPKTDDITAPPVISCQRLMLMLLMPCKVMCRKHLCIA